MCDQEYFAVSNQLKIRKVSLQIDTFLKIKISHATYSSQAFPALPF